MLKGFIHDYSGERSADQYIKTTKEIINYVGRTYTKYTLEFTRAVKELELQMPLQPPNPPDGNNMAFEIWKLDIKDHHNKIQEYDNF